MINRILLIIFALVLAFPIKAKDVVILEQSATLLDQKSVVVTIKVQLLEKRKKVRYYFTDIARLDIPNYNHLCYQLQDAYSPDDNAKTKAHFGERSRMFDGWVIEWRKCSENAILTINLLFKHISCKSDQFGLPRGLERAVPTGVSVFYLDNSDARVLCPPKTEYFPYFNTINVENNPRVGYFDVNNENEIKRLVDQSNDPLCGIYEPVEEQFPTLACIKHTDGKYYLVYVSPPSSWRYGALWKVGDVWAWLRPTATVFYKADWYEETKGLLSNAVVTFERFYMKVKVELPFNQEYSFIKTYPTR